MNLTELQKAILVWANERDLLHIENIEKQEMKLFEELGETAGAILKSKPEEIKDGIGDCYVVLCILEGQYNNGKDFTTAMNLSNLIYTEKYTLPAVIFKIAEAAIEMSFETSIDMLNSLAHELNLDLEECANAAYNEIKNRKGKTVGGTFIKD